VVTVAREPLRPSKSRVGAVVAAAVTVAVGVAVAVSLLAATQRLASAEPLAAGALVSYGLPACRVLHDLAAALTIGALVLAAWLVAREPDSSPEELSGRRWWLVHVGFAAAVVWAGSSAAVLLLSASEVSGIGLGEPDFAAAVRSFVLQTDLGRQLAYSFFLIILVAAVAVVATRVTAAAGAAVLAIVALLPVAFGGHAAGARHHVTATDSLAIHLVAVSVWVGGLAAWCWSPADSAGNCRRWPAATPPWPGSALRPWRRPG